MSVERLSVCIPTHNGEPWIASTIQSILSQDQDFEVVVSDDASSDSTVDIARSLNDPRVRVERSESRIGMARNWNRAVELSHGEYVKLLMQDDELLPGALSVQASLLERHPTAGFAFGPRLLDGDGSAAAARWMRAYGTPHATLGITDELVPGSRVVEAHTRGRLRGNAIGEPSVVMIRRSTLQQSGMFNPRLRQLTDLDLWIRLASVADVAFDPRPVARFRVHAASATQRNRALGDAWLDRLYIVDGLRRDSRTRQRVGVRHYATAVAAGGLEVSKALLSRRRSLYASWRDLRAFVERKAPEPLGPR